MGGRTRANTPSAIAALWVLAGHLFVGLALPAAAQNQGLVVRDGSLGAELPGVVSSGIDDLGQHADYLIRADLGEQRGGNLFHSFERFSIGTGETATFTAQGAPEPGAIDNVISRVTGGSVSDIDGTLRSTIAGADVWLMNPNGLVFGQNARLDVPAGFHASTADSLELANGEVFEARADAPLPVLAVDPPEAFGFLGVSDIRIDGSFLAVPDGEALSLAAGGSVPSSGYLYAAGGSIEIKGARIDLDGPVGANPADGDGGSVRLVAQDEVSVRGEVNVDGGSGTGRGGGILVEAPRITVHGRFGASGGNGNGGSVLLDGQEAVTVGGTVSADGFSSGGEVTVRALKGVVAVEDSGAVSADAFFSGNGGVIVLEGQRLRLDGQVSALGAGGESPGTITLIGELERQGGVVRDGSLGDAPAGVVPSGFDEGRLVDYLITPELGRVVGHNLFHSFSRFDVAFGEIATFTGPDLLRNIVARVTGNDLSEIYGSVRSTAPNADLYLLNPAGIVFGQGAMLDVARGFHASTADRLAFRDEDMVTEVFEAHPNGAVPALETTLPIDFGFLDENTAPITVEPLSSLALRNGASLSVEGAGPVTIAGSLSVSGLGGELAVRGDTVSVNGRVSAENSSARGGKVLLEGQSAVTVGGTVSADGQSGGQVNIAGDTISVNGLVSANGGPGIGGSGGSVLLEGQDAVTVEGTVSADDSSGSGGEATIHGDTVTVNGRVSAIGVNGGGEVTVRGDTVTVNGSVSVRGSPGIGGSGGSVLLEGRNAVMVEGTVSADGRGGGEVTVHGDTVTVNGFVSVLGFSGNGGSVLLEGQDAVTVAGTVSARGSSGGDVTIRSREGAVAVEDLALVSADAFSSGNGGHILLEGRRLRLDGQLSVDGAGGGIPGTITLIGEIERDRENGVVRDGSLGDAPAGVAPLGFEGGILSDYLITPELGRLVGHNLFHSFARFDVAAGELATFTGPESLRHILARVTGNDASEVYGTVRATPPNADLYLLNPAGLLFGPGATIDVPGSFHASTADRVDFTEGELVEVFEARVGGAVPTLETGVPGEFGFLDMNTAPITVDYLLAVDAVNGDPSLSLEGAGPVTIAGFFSADGDDGGEVTIRGDTVTVDGSVSATGVTGNGGSLLLEGQRAVTVGGSVSSQGTYSGGEVTIRSPGGAITVEPAGSVGADGDNEDGGVILLEGEGAVTVAGTVSADGSHSGGEVTIRSHAGDLTVGDAVDGFGSISASGSSGSGGSVLFEGQEAVTLGGSVFAHGSRGGDVTVRGNTVDAAGWISTNGSSAIGGSVLLEGQEAVTVSNFVSVEGSDGGDITVRAPSGTVTLGEFGYLVANAWGDGNNGGHLLLEAETLRIEGYLSASGAGAGSLGTLTVLGEIEGRDGVVRDGSLGGAPAGIVPVGLDALGFVDYLITPELGQLVGHNLFHSFSRFDLAYGEVVAFTGPDGLRSIAARVTGNDLSEIYGTIRSTSPNADLYLLNPAGFIFGAGGLGAQLDVPAGFHASTADSLGFGQEESLEVFEARSEGPVPTLEAALPTEFGFLGSNTAPITIEPGTSLAVRNGSSLSLVGAGPVAVGSLRADGPSGGEVTLRGDTISLHGLVSASGSAGVGGSVLLEGTDAVIVRGAVSADGRSGGGDITVRAPSGTVVLGRLASVDADASRDGDGGRLLLEGRTLRLDESRLSARGAGAGSPGTITLIGEREAGVVRDGSLGNAPAGTVPSGFDRFGLVDYLITPEFGRLVGHNLFHSFSRFDLAPDEIASFTGPDSLHHIVARVTGNDLSEIYGTVRSTPPNADLYLLNPAGFLFGSGTGLSVPAGFHASTADSLGFEEEGVLEVFEARSDGAVPMLEAALPTEFGFLDTNTAPITVEPFTSLSFFRGASLSLVGAGPVTVGGSVGADGPDGGEVTVRGKTVDIDGFVSAYGYFGSGGTIRLGAEEGLTVRGTLTALGSESGGEIQIEAEDQVLIDGSQIQAWGQGQGGEIHISNKGDVTIRSSMLLVAASGAAGTISISCGAETCANHLVMRDGAVLDAGGFAGSFGTGGSIEIHVGTLDLDGESMMAASGFFGTAGSIDIHGDVAVRIANTGGRPVDFTDLLELGGTVPGVVAPSLAWPGGRIVIEAPSVVVEEGAAVWVQSGVLGGGGSILLQGNVIEILSGAAIDGSSLLGDGGSIEVLGRTSVAISGAGEEGPSRVRALGAGGGNGGSILVSAPQIVLDGGAIATSSTDQAGTGRAGASGAITLIGDEIALSGGARVDTSTFTPGDGGAIHLSAPVITIEGQGTRVSARAGGEGHGGQVTIEAGDLTVRDGATIGAESRAGFTELDAVFGDALRLAEAVLKFLFPRREPQDPPLVAQGAGGLVEVSADRVLLESHGSIVASTSGPGAGGDVVVETPLLELTGGSSISAASTGAGNAGSVHISADELHAEDGSEISVTATSADGGDVTLTVADRIHLVNSTISADVGDGTGGNITIDPTFVILDHSDIVARAGAGTGGEITIIADALIKDPESVIDASAGNPALSGTVNINAPDVDLAGSLAALADSALDASDQLAERCSARGRGEGNGSFTVAGAGLRPGPEGWLSAWSQAPVPPGPSLALASGRCH